MTIENEQQAKDAVAAVAKWLEIQGATIEDPKALAFLDDLVRNMAIELLEASGCHGMSGCLLCQS